MTRQGESVPGLSTAKRTLQPLRHRVSNHYAIKSKLILVIKIKASVRFYIVGLARTLQTPANAKNPPPQMGNIS